MIHTAWPLKVFEFVILCKHLHLKIQMQKISHGDIAYLKALACQKSGKMKLNGYLEISEV